MAKVALVSVAARERFEPIVAELSLVECGFALFLFVCKRRLVFVNDEAIFAAVYADELDLLSVFCTFFVTVNIRRHIFIFLGFFVLHVFWKCVFFGFYSYFFNIFYIKIYYILQTMFLT